MFIATTTIQIDRLAYKSWLNFRTQLSVPTINFDDFCLAFFTEIFLSLPREN